MTIIIEFDNIRSKVILVFPQGQGLMKVNETIKKVIQLYPKIATCRSEALLFIFTSRNSYRWQKGALVSKADAQKKATKFDSKLPLESQKLIRSLKRVCENQAKAMENSYLKAHTQEQQKLKKIVREAKIRSEVKRLPRKVEMFAKDSPIFRIPKSIQPEWASAAMEALEYVVKKDKKHRQSKELLKKLGG